MKQKISFSVTAVPDGVDPMEFLEQVMHDCPECQAARARGEEPKIVMHDNDGALVAPVDPSETRQVRRARVRKWMRGRG
jgi:hypothetical protein